MSIPAFTFLIRNRGKSDLASHGAAVLAKVWLLGISYIVVGLIWICITRSLIEANVPEGLASQQGARLLLTGGLLPVVIISAILMMRQARSRMRAESRIERIADALPGMFALVNSDGIVTYANLQFLRTLSPSCQARAELPLETMLAPYLPPLHGNPLLPAQGETTIELVLSDGAEAGRVDVSRRVGVRVRPVDDRDPSSGWTVTCNDDAENRELRNDHSLKSYALEIVMDGLVIADLHSPDMPVIYVNRGFQAITGYAPHEVLGRNLRFLQGNDRIQPEIDVLRDSLRKLQPVTVTLRNYRRDGSLFWNEMRCSPIRDANGHVSHYIGVLRDVTDLKRSQQDVERLTYHDPVTKLLNRAQFTQEISCMLERMPATLLLMTFEVMRLGDITSCFGVAAGDALLVDIANRLSSISGALASRLGDSSFGVVVRLVDEIEAGDVAEDLRTILREPFRSPDGAIDLLFSIGMAIGLPGMTGPILVDQALTALNQSSQAQNGATRSFDPATGEDIRRRVGLSRDLHQAIGRSDFMLHLQPIVALDDGNWIGAEALVRWRHPVFGLQSPDLFVPVSEQTGQILGIDEWALRNGAALARKLNDGGQDPFAVSVNISSMQLQHNDLAPMLGEILRETGAAPWMLKLEIAERVLAGGSADIIEDLERLHALGFGIVVDDFGVGTSSLSQLNKLPVTEIKLDRSFIRGCETCSYRQMVIQAFVAIGQTLAIKVTAKGVENEAQQSVLKELGLRQAQGFLFGRPIDAAEFSALRRCQLRPASSVLPPQDDRGRL